MEVYGNRGYKPPLKSSPFVRYFEFGANYDGYWNYSYLVMQFEDCVDCLKYLYPEYDLCFFLDHSSGHAKKRTNGLDVSLMKKGYAGKQPAMDPSMITQKEGYVGPYYQPTSTEMVTIGDEPKIVFPKGKIYCKVCGPW